MASATPMPEPVDPTEPHRSRQAASTCCSGAAPCPHTWGHTMALSEEGHKLHQERHPTAVLLLRGARGSSGRVNRRPTADSEADSRAGKGHLNTGFSSQIVSYSPGGWNHCRPGLIWGCPGAGRNPHSS